jgi:predicted esterase
MIEPVIRYASIMKISTSILRLPGVFLICLLTQSARSQQMLSPQDTIVNYNPASPPVQPAFGKIGKWVRTPSLDWNTTAYKCYIYDSCDFRLRFPQTWQPGDGKKYPILIFYHGDGEIGPVTDNESQLKNGGYMFDTAVVYGKYNGFVLFMQNQHEFGLTQYTAIRNLIDTLVQEYGGDPYRVVANGLSGGGQAIFNQLVLTPSYFSGAVLMSAALEQYAVPADVNILKFTPMWDLDGGLDNDPTPAQAQFVDSSYLSLGSDYVYKNYSTLGHDTWDSTWLEPNFWPFLNNSYLSNPWTLYGKTVFCSGQSFKVAIGIVSGLAGYQWRLNGTVIPNATTDSIVVTQPGTYDARVLRGSTWSDWSHVPVQIFGQVPAPVADIVQPNCTVSTGTITFAQPISSALTFSIDGIHYQTDSVFPKLAAGTYTLTAKNGSTCMSAPTTAVIYPQPVTPAQPTVTITQPSCTVPKATIVLTSSDTGLVYSLNNGGSYVTYSQFGGLTPGTYWPKVKNGGGCASAFMISVVNPGPPLPPAPAVMMTQPTCTVPTGTIAISSPVDSFSYSINNSSYLTGGTFSGLGTGSYPVTSKNSEGCVSTPSTAVILASPQQPPAPGVTVVQPTCTVSTGTIAISSPIDSFSYSINNSSYVTGGTFSSLTTGSYPVTSKNSEGCISTPSTAVILTPPSPPPAPGVTVAQPTCTVPTGTIAISSPVDSFSYSINNSSYLTGGTFSGLATGSYPVTAENSEGCISTPSTAVILTPPSPPPAPGVTIVQPTCTVATGTIAISSPVDSFSYSINNSSYLTGGTFSGLTTGSYPVTAENSEGCISTPSTAVILTQPQQPPAPGVTVVQPTCTVPTGSITISSPADSLSYSINNSSYLTGGNFSDLTTGSYPVTAENSAGCISSPSMAVILTPPPPPSAPGLTVVQPTCTVPTGSIDIAGPLGPGLIYSVNGTSYQLDTSFTSLPSGSYPVTARDSAGCVSPSSLAVILPAAAAPPAPVFDLVQPDCSVATGTIDIISPAGTGVFYSINGSNWLTDTSFGQLAPGTYQLIVKNGAGCLSSPASAVILAKPAACNMVVGVYPNPYVGEVNFTIVSPESGKGLLMFYSIVGQRLNAAIETEFVAGIPTSIVVPMDFAHEQTVVYQLTIGKKKIQQGILLPQRF